MCNIYRERERHKYKCTVHNIHIYIYIYIYTYTYTHKHKYKAGRTIAESNRTETTILRRFPEPKRIETDLVEGGKGCVATGLRCLSLSLSLYVYIYIYIFVNTHNI